MESYRLPPLPPKPCPIISLQKHRGAGPSSILRSLSAISHLPYTLPSSVSCKSFACHFYASSASRTVLRDENRRRVHQQFPFRNLRLSTHHFTELLSFHTLAHSFAPRKKSTLLFSIHSALFVKNSRVGEGSMLTIGPSSERSVFPPQRVFSFHLRELRILPALCTTNPQIRCAPRKNAIVRRNTFRCMGHLLLVAAPPRCVESLFFFGPQLSTVNLPPAPPAPPICLSQQEC